MGLCRIILLTTLISLVSYIYLTLIKNSDVQLAENIYDDHYWGSKILKDGEPLPKDDPIIRPFKVVYDNIFIEDLHERLNRARFVEPLQNTNFENGFNGNYLKKIVHYWKENYNWKKQVNYLNSLPQFKTQIEGLDVHFVHVKALGKPKIIKTIMLTNGWPSNFFQYYELTELLRKPVNDIAFNVIIPSRPGFGYSEHPHLSGFSITDSVRIYVKLMDRLGYDKFFYHGEDWGALEGHAIAALYPNRIEGVHFGMALSNINMKLMIRMAIGAYFPGIIYSDAFEAKQFESPIKIIETIASEMGYFILQSSKPDTLGALLIDSPVGLAAYVLEKYSTWINKAYKHLPDGGLTKKLSLDNLLTNIMLFWQTSNGAYSTRYYKEHITSAIGLGQDVIKKHVNQNIPIGFSIGEHELDIGKLRPRNGYNIVKFDYIKETGHFSGLENPIAVNEHIRKFCQIVIDSQKGKNLKEEF